ncbi:HEAT repeat domain-containing protein [Streptomyces sp. NPDC004647]|uniref:HEAT repeat domain-containing protein n=1 Tax=Streptomyces sp. NPDC004647 TaxID=3154671 RepID=UPI0033B4A8B5
MEEEFRALARRVHAELAGPGETVEYERLITLAERGGGGRDEELARILTEPGRPLWAREIAAYALGCAGDRRAFETLVLLLNHRDPPRCATAAHALARLGDPRTGRAAATLATNRLRTAYALHPVRLLTALRTPESVPALIATLEPLLAPGAPAPLVSPLSSARIALACVEGLGALGDERAVPVLTAARDDPRLAAAASAALARMADGAGA